MNAKPLPSSPKLSEWLSWPREDVARWISARPEPVVMGWPYNGTRRWYRVHRSRNSDAEDYLALLIRRQAEHHRLVFEHGVSVLLAPSFGFETLKRGEEYVRYALSGLLRLADDKVYQGMFSAGVRIRFYGDYEVVLQDTLSPEHHGPILEACARLTEETSNGSGPMLLLGLFADDHYPAIARISVEFAKTHGRIPSRREMVEAYYGVEVPDLGFYLGFQEPQLFDVPLVCNGLEHLYATLNPSPDLTERQLREILYDHLLARAVPPVDYESLSPRALQRIASENELYTGSTIGLGQVDALTGLWKPKLPGDC